MRRTVEPPPADPVELPADPVDPGPAKGGVPILTSSSRKVLKVIYGC